MSSPAIPNFRRGRGIPSYRVFSTAVTLRKRRAAQIAADHHHGIPLKLSRNGKFCRLAAVLWGGQKANLYHYCSAVKAGQNRA
jgi:hypothetical protein